MVKGVDRQRAVADDGVELAAGLDGDIVKVGRAALGRAVAAKVLEHAATGGHVEDLAAAADAEERQIRRERGLRQLNLQFVAQEVDRLWFGAGKRLAEVTGMDVTAARENQAIEST